MSVNASQLASDIATALGHAGDVTSQVLGLATGILQELTQHGHATTGPASGNHISGMTNTSMASKVQAAAGYPNVSTELSQFCKGVTDHIQGAGTVTYTGPGPVFSTGGTIHGLSGSAMAALVASDVGYPSVTSQLLGTCNAIANHIMNNAQVNGGVIS